MDKRRPCKCHGACCYDILRHDRVYCEDNGIRAEIHEYKAKRRAGLIVALLLAALIILMSLINV